MQNTVKKSDLRHSYRRKNERYACRIIGVDFNRQLIVEIFRIIQGNELNI